MNIQEFIECKEKLEQDIAGEIENKIAAFEKRTGVKITSLTVNTTSTRTFGGDESFCVLDVDAGVKL